MSLYPAKNRIIIPRPSKSLYRLSSRACREVNINSQLDATVIILLLIISINWTCFGRKFRPSSGALDCIYSLWYEAKTMLPAGHQQAASSVLYTTSFKHSLVLLRMGEIIVRNILSWLKFLIIKLLLLHGHANTKCAEVFCSHYFC